MKTAAIEKLTQLYDSQLSEWPDLAEATRLLSRVESRKLSLAHQSARIDHNPGRIKSSGAKVDQRSIAARPCFLCGSNRPSEQRAEPLLAGFEALCNPVPIFPLHFTISSIIHRPQTLDSLAMLELSRILTPWVVFYNGAQAGASAPDHLHFQCTPSEMPLIEELNRSKALRIVQSSSISVSLFNYWEIGAIVIESKQAEMIDRTIKSLLLRLDLERPSGSELFNLCAQFLGSSWRLIAFPRKAHRPACYFAESGQNRLISPGTVEMCGLVMAARQEDYQSLSATELQAIYREVAFTESESHELVRRLLEH